MPLYRVVNTSEDFKKLTSALILGDKTAVPSKKQRTQLFRYKRTQEHAAALEALVEIVVGSRTTLNKYTIDGLE